MTESGATAVRILRTLVATLVVVGLGGSAHVLGGGAGLAPIPVAILLVLVGPLVWLLVRSRTSLPRMLLATGAGQVVAHLALMGMEPTADGTAVAPHVHDAVDMSGGRSTSPVALHLTGSMVLAHALATVAHAQRWILAGVADLARVRWVQRGFREPHEGPGVPMRNLLARSTAPCSPTWPASTPPCSGSGTTLPPGCAEGRRWSCAGSRWTSTRGTGWTGPRGRTPSVAASTPGPRSRAPGSTTPPTSRRSTTEPGQILGQRLVS